MPWYKRIRIPNVKHCRLVSYSGGQHHNVVEVDTRGSRRLEEDVWGVRNAKTTSINCLELRIVNPVKCMYFRWMFTYFGWIFRIIQAKQRNIPYLYGDHISKSGWPWPSRRYALHEYTKLSILVRIAATCTQKILGHTLKVENAKIREHILK